MNTKRYLGWMLVFGLVLGSIGLVQGQPVLNVAYSLSDESPSAGSTVFYYVTITNIGMDTAEDVKVSMIEDFGGSLSDVPDFYRPRKQVLGDLLPGESATASYSIFLGDRSVGIRKLQSIIEYAYLGSQLEIENTKFLTVGESKLELIELSSTEKPLVPGEINTLKILLKNKELTKAKKFKFSFNGGSSSIQPVGKSVIYYDGEVASGQKMRLSFNVYVNENTQSGVYPASLQVDYIGGGTERTETIPLGLRIEDKAQMEIGSILTDPVDIKEGDKNVKLNLEVQNIGGETAKNVKVRLDLKKPFELSSLSQETQSLGIIQASASTTATFFFDVDEKVSSGRYEIPIEIEYLDARGKKHSEKEVISIGLKSVPILEIDKVRFVPETLAQGDRVRMYLTLKNIGTEEAQGVSVKVLESIEQPFEFDEKTDRVGKLDVGETGDALVVFTIDPDANLKEYIVDLEIRYTDGSDVYIKEESARVDVSVERGTNRILYVVLVIVVLTIVYALASRRKKKGSVQTG